MSECVLASGCECLCVSKRVSGRERERKSVRDVCV